MPDDLFCGECGQDLRTPKKPTPIDYGQPQSYTPKHLAAKILTTRSAIEGERKLVTVMFADVAGFTALSEKLDSEDVHRIMDGCCRILVDAIHRFEGTVGEFRGDGVMALFGAPIAHEDHAQRACHAALAIQQALIPYGEEVKQKYGIAFRMRIGLNSGTVVVGSIGDDLRMDYTAMGDTTNLAARMEALAEPGGVLLSDNTSRLVRDYFECLSKGPALVKGKEEPQETFELIGRKEIETRLEASVARGLTDLVGRRWEMEFLEDAFERVKEGEAQIVDIVGEAGVGKSRLVYEFHGSLGEMVTLAAGKCRQYGRHLNFFPVIGLLKGVWKIAEGTPEEEISRRIEQETGGDLKPLVPFFRNLLSLKVEDPQFIRLDPEGRKFATFEAVRELLIYWSRGKPLLVFLEDIHWMDKISEDLFAFMSRSVAGQKIMMLSTYRPEATPPWAQDTPHFKKINLETLSPKLSVRLIRNILGGFSLEPTLERRLIEKTAGNPFFIEEIVRDLVDRKDIAVTGDTCRSTRPIDQMEIPDTVQGVLAARMDRLKGDLKRIVQVASVIGREFPYGILQDVMEFDDSLKDHLTSLEHLEILYEKTLFPEREYIFKHALTREVAYESLLKQRRQEIHGRIARAMEDRYKDRIEEMCEILAHHYKRSGKAEEAVKYLLMAGEKSNHQDAVQAAAEFFGQALDLSEKEGLSLSPEKEIRLYRGLGRASISIGSIGKGGEALKKAIELTRQHGLVPLEKKALRQFGAISGLLPDREDTEQILKTALSRAQELEDKPLQIHLLACLGLNTAIYGDPYKGLEIVLEAERIGKESGKPPTVLMARYFRSMLERWQGNPKETIRLTEGMLETMRSLSSLAIFSGIVYLRGLAMAEIGRIEESLDLLRQGILVCEKFGVTLRLGSLYNSLGYAYAQIYQTEEAWRCNLESEKIARRMMQKYPLGNRLYAETVAQATVNLIENLLDLGRLEEATQRRGTLKQEAKGEAYFILRHQWESRLDLVSAKLLAAQGDPESAERLTRENLQGAQRLYGKKRQGCCYHLLGEIRMGDGDQDNTLSSLREAVHVLAEVGNCRHLWEAQADLGRAYEKFGRFSEAGDLWGAAAATIQKVAGGLRDRGLREGFLNAHPVREILARAEQ